MSISSASKTSGSPAPTIQGFSNGLRDVGRGLLTHDVSTLSKHAYERVATGQPMPGVFEIPTDLSIARAIDDLILIVERSLEGEWEGQVRYLPL